MSTAGPKETLWEAPAHSIAKIDILKAYLVAYFQILGRSKIRQNILYVDGFAGPDEYTDFPYGSPTAALNALQAAIANSADAWRAGDVHCAFVERKKERYDHLQKRLKMLSGLSPRIKIHAYNAQFTDALPLIRKAVPEPFETNSPLFVFIDPFGAIGSPFSTVAEILNSSCSEVLINLDADGVSRIYRAKESAKYVETLNEIFGDASWQQELTDDDPFDMQCRKILQLYKDRLRMLPDVRYIFEVEMQGTSRTLNYFLVFASKHPLGLVKMKEAMKTISQNGNYKFADADVYQSALFRFDEPQAYYLKLYEAFKHRKIKFNDLTDDVTAFTLNHTPFVRATSMLSILEREGMITAKSSDLKRKRGTFNESVNEIDFHGRAENGSLF